MTAGYILWINCESDYGGTFVDDFEANIAVQYWKL